MLMRDKYKRHSVLLLAVFLLVTFVLEQTGESRRRKRRRARSRHPIKIVVVLPFTGPKAAKARAGFIRGLRKKRVKALSYKRYKKTASTLGVEEKSSDGITAICSKLQCHAVVVGSVRKRRRRYRITVEVINGGTGETMGRRAASVRGARRLSRAGVTIARGSVQLIRKGMYQKDAPKPKPVATVDPVEPQAVSKRTDTSDIPIYKPTKRNKQTDDDEDDAWVKSRSKKNKSKMSGLFEVSASVGIAFRSYELHSGELTVNPNLYKGSMYPEFVLRGDFYPLVLFLDNALNGIGLGVTYSHHITISTKPEASTDQEVDTSSQELLLDLRYRFALFDTDTSPVLGGSFGWGLRDFTLGTNSILTSFNYRFLRIALEGMIPFMTPLIGLHIKFDIRPIIAVGEEAVYAFGDRQAGFGFSIEVGLMGRLAFGLFYFANFEFLRFSTTFLGLPPEATIRPNTPDRNDYTKGIDQFIRLWLGIGYAM